MLLARRQPDKPAAATNKLCSIRTRNGLYTEFGIDPLTYYAYAKDLCEHYNFDRNKYRLCVKEKRFAAITKSDFAKLKEDLQFLDDALKTVLVTYQDYFRERFVDGLSIRKYAVAHQLNRGSVDHLQKKFFSALARLLKERDEAEGKCRLRKPVQN